MISIKPGAKIKGIQPEILLGVSICEAIFKKYGFDLIITEGTGAKHMPGSLHYKGLAVDIRSNNIPSDPIKYQILADCVHALSSDFDMILENPTDKDAHYHLEWDPQ